MPKLRVLIRNAGMQDPSEAWLFSRTADGESYHSMPAAAW